MEVNDLNVDALTSEECYTLVESSTNVNANSHNKHQTFRSSRRPKNSVPVTWLDLSLFACCGIRKSKKSSANFSGVDDLKSYHNVKRKKRKKKKIVQDSDGKSTDVEGETKEPNKRKRNQKENEESKSTETRERKKKRRKKKANAANDDSMSSVSQGNRKKRRKKKDISENDGDDSISRSKEKWKTKDKERNADVTTGKDVIGNGYYGYYEPFFDQPRATEATGNDEAIQFQLTKSQENKKVLIRPNGLPVSVSSSVESPDMMTSAVNKHLQFPLTFDEEEEGRVADESDQKKAVKSVKMVRMVCCGCDASCCDGSPVQQGDCCNCVCGCCEQKLVLRKCCRLGNKWTKMSDSSYCCPFNQTKPSFATAPITPNIIYNDTDGAKCDETKTVEPSCSCKSFSINDTKKQFCNDQVRNDSTCGDFSISRGPRQPLFNAIEKPTAQYTCKSTPTDVKMDECLTHHIYDTVFDKANASAHLFQSKNNSVNTSKSKKASIFEAECKDFKLRHDNEDDSRISLNNSLSHNCNLQTNSFSQNLYSDPLRYAFDDKICPGNEDKPYASKQNKNDVKCTSSVSSQPGQKTTYIGPRKSHTCANFNTAEVSKPKNLDCDNDKLCELLRKVNLPSCQCMSANRYFKQFCEEATKCVDHGHIANNSTMQEVLKSFNIESSNIMSNCCCSCSRLPYPSNYQNNVEQTGAQQLQHQQYLLQQLHSLQQSMYQYPSNLPQQQFSSQRPIQTPYPTSSQLYSSQQNSLHQNNQDLNVYPQIQPVAHQIQPAAEQMQSIPQSVPQQQSQLNYFPPVSLNHLQPTGTMLQHIRTGQQSPSGTYMQNNFEASQQHMQQKSLPHQETSVNSAPITSVKDPSQHIHIHVSCSYEDTSTCSAKREKNHERDDKMCSSEEVHKNSKKKRSMDDKKIASIYADKVHGVERNKDNLKKLAAVSGHVENYADDNVSRRRSSVGSHRSERYKDTCRSYESVHSESELIPVIQKQRTKRSQNHQRYMIVGKVAGAEDFVEESSEILYSNALRSRQLDKQQRYLLLKEAEYVEEGLMSGTPKKAHYTCKLTNPSQHIRRSYPQKSSRKALTTLRRHSDGTITYPVSPEVEDYAKKLVNTAYGDSQAVGILASTSDSSVAGETTTLQTDSSVKPFNISDAEKSTGSKKRRKKRRGSKSSKRSGRGRRRRKRSGSSSSISEDNEGRSKKSSKSSRRGNSSSRRKKQRGQGAGTDADSSDGSSASVGKRKGRRKKKRNRAALKDDSSISEGGAFTTLTKGVDRKKKKQRRKQKMGDDENSENQEKTSRPSNNGSFSGIGLNGGEGASAKRKRKKRRKKKDSKKSNNNETDFSISSSFDETSDSLSRNASNIHENYNPKKTVASAGTTTKQSFCRRFSSAIVRAFSRNNGEDVCVLSSDPPNYCDTGSKKSNTQTNYQNNANDIISNANNLLTFSDTQNPLNSTCFNVNIVQPIFGDYGGKRHKHVYLYNNLKRRIKMPNKSLTMSYFNFFRSKNTKTVWSRSYSATQNNSVTTNSCSHRTQSQMFYVCGQSQQTIPTATNIEVCVWPGNNQSEACHTDDGNSVTISLASWSEHAL